MPGQTASESGFHFLQDYLKCQQFFRWSYIENLEPATKAPALIFGTAIHVALATWYEQLKAGLPFDTKLASALTVFRGALDEEKEQYQNQDKYDEDLTRGQILLQAYAVTYPAEPWEVLAIEEPIQYVFPDSGDIFTGRVDLVVRNQGRVYIVDHKTTGWSISSLTRSLQVSDQGTGYIWLWNKAKPELPVNGIIFNILRQYKTSNDFQQVLVMKTVEDVDRFRKESSFVLNEIATKVSDPDAIWPRNTGACFLFNRPCKYMDLCFGSAYQEGLIGHEYRVREGKASEEELHQD